MDRFSKIQKKSPASSDNHPADKKRDRRRARRTMDDLCPWCEKFHCPECDVGREPGDCCRLECLGEG